MNNDEWSISSIFEWSRFFQCIKMNNNNESNESIFFRFIQHLENTWSKTIVEKNSLMSVLPPIKSFSSLSYSVQCPFSTIGLCLSVFSFFDKIWHYKTIKVSVCVCVKCLCVYLIYIIYLPFTWCVVFNAWLSFFWLALTLHVCASCKWPYSQMVYNAYCPSFTNDDNWLMMMMMMMIDEYCCREDR